MDVLEKIEQKARELYAEHYALLQLTSSKADHAGAASRLRNSWDVDAQYEKDWWVGVAEVVLADANYAKVSTPVQTSWRRPRMIRTFSDPTITLQRSRIPMAAHSGARRDDMMLDEAFQWRIAQGDQTNAVQAQSESENGHCSSDCTTRDSSASPSTSSPDRTSGFELRHSLCKNGGTPGSDAYATLGNMPFHKECDGRRELHEAFGSLSISIATFGRGTGETCGLSSG